MSQGKLEVIWIKRFKFGPMDKKNCASLVAGRGLADNVDQGGKRQVTLIKRKYGSGTWKSLAPQSNLRPDGLIYW